LEEKKFDLTLVHIDRNGAPNNNYLTQVIGLDQYLYQPVFDPDGTVTVRLPNGRYLLDSLSPAGTEEPDAASLLVDPSVNLTKDTTVTLDERAAKPVSITVPEKSARSRQLDISYFISAPGVGAVGGGVEATHATISTALLAPPPTDLPITAAVADFQAVPGKDGTYTDSPFIYDLYWPVGEFPTGFQRSVRHQDVATVAATYAQQAAGMTASSSAVSLGPDLDFQAPYLNFRLPFARTEYYSPGVPWQSSYGESNGTPAGGSSVSGAPVTRQAGKRYYEPWNGAALGPGVAWYSDYGPCHGAVVRQDDRIEVCIGATDDAGGHLGSTAFTRARTTLYRDGVLVDENPYDPGSGYFYVPPEPAAYRLEIAGTRLDPDARISTQLTAAWTFRSENMPDPVAKPVSMLGVRFTPLLDLYNRAPAGIPYVIPVVVEHQPGAATADLTTLNMDVSYDDGKTWRAASLTKTNERWFASVRHPASSGFVSLRAKAADASGNTVEETIIRAYEIKA
jgi:hypothetical protein